jgi:hypothetical protein
MTSPQAFRCAPRPARRLAAPLAGLTAVGALLLTASPAPATSAPAAAAHLPAADAPTPEEANTLSWSVRPTPTDTAENRPNYNLTAKGGDTIADSIRVRNFGSRELLLKIYASDARTTETGAMDLLPAGEAPKDVGAWITLEKADLRVPAGEHVDVPFTMSVPDNAESGDHTGGIVTSVVAESTNDKGEPVKLDRRLGTRVQVRIDGPLRPLLQLSGMTTSYNGSANPVGRGRMNVTYTVTNTGNVRMAADQGVTVKGPLGFGSRKAKLEAMPELLPGNSLTLSTDVPAWATLHTSTNVRLVPKPVREGDDFAELGTVAASTGDWVVPWSTLALLALAGAGAGGAVAVRRRQAAREQGRIDAAVEERLQGGRTGAGFP